MKSDAFQFRQFTVSQHLCGMKVGTDGVLLGAWAQGGSRILDVGTGTGLIALMMAQRYGDAHVSAIDIEQDAVCQASANVAASPFPDRIAVVHASLQDFCRQAEQKGRYDAIVSNPPFFMDSLLPDDARRLSARHTVTLTYAELMACARKLLAADGELSVVVPFNYRQQMDNEAVFSGFFPCRVCGVKTSAAKPPKRYLLSYRLRPCSLSVEELTVGDECYSTLTQAFYL